MVMLVLPLEEFFDQHDLRAFSELTQGVVGDEKLKLRIASSGTTSAPTYIDSRPVMHYHVVHAPKD